MQFLDSNNNEIPPHDLPRLVVLTGLNGSGKTRGLKTIGEGSASYFDYRSFDANWTGTHEPALGLPPFGRPLQPMHRAAEISDSDYQVLEPLIKKRENISPEYFSAQLNQDELQEFVLRNLQAEPIAEITRKFLSLLPEGENTKIETQLLLLSNDSDICDRYCSDVRTIAGSTFGNVVKSKKIPLHLCSGINLTHFASEGQASFDPLRINMISMMNDFLYARHMHTTEAHRLGLTYDDAISIFHTKTPPPWKTMNTILTRLSLREQGTKVFQFNIDDPEKEGLIPPEKIAAKRAVDQVTLWSTAKSQAISIAELSSGEKTLLGLATLLYTHKFVRNKPFLCLDEVDASLHPTMIQSMLDVLDEQSKLTRIFLATHSPSTVALVPEPDKSLFFVEDGKAKKIGRTEALEGLTQGFLTTEGISSVFRSLRGIDKQIIVISEGNNYEYLEPMFEKVGIDKQCHIHRYKKARSNSKGATEFKVLHQLFCDLIDTLPNGKKFVFLVDCDQCNEIAKWDNKGNAHVIALALKQIKANPEERGIENVVPAALLVELESELKDKGEESIYKEPKNPSKGIDRKDHVGRKFINELKSPNSRIDIATLKYTLSDLIALCTN